MEYDEIDEYVNQLFNKGPSGDGTKGNGLNGDVLSGDWRIDRIDQIIEDAYNEAIWWHNQRISEGCDPHSGLRNLPYVPWDESIDGVAAMHGGGGMWEAQPRQVGKNWTDAEYAAYKRKVAAGFDPYANMSSNSQPSQQESGWGCTIAVLCVVLVALFVWMLTV